jgi:hypothetical protein
MEKLPAQPCERVGAGMLKRMFVERVREMSPMETVLVKVTFAGIGLPMVSWAEAAPEATRSSMKPTIPTPGGEDAATSGASARLLAGAKCPAACVPQFEFGSIGGYLRWAYE